MKFLEISTVLFISSISAMYFYPPLQAMYGLVQIFIIGVLFLILYWKSVNLKPFLKSLCWYFLYVFIYFSLGLNGNAKMGLFHPLLIFFIIFLPHLLFEVLIRRNKPFEMKLTVILITSLIFYVFMISYKELQLNANLLRDLTSGSSGENDMLRSMQEKGIGGIGYAYMGGLISTFCLSVSLLAKSKKLRLLFIFLSVLSLIFVLKAIFATVILITVVSLFSCLFFYYNKFYSRVLLVLFALVFVLFANVIILNVFIDNDSGIITKLSGVFNFLSGESENTQSLLESHRTQYRNEILALSLQSPLWGFDVTVGDKARLFGVCHSTFLGVLISTGLLGLLGFYKSFHVMYEHYSSKFTRRISKVILYPLIIFFLSMSFFNPIIFSFEIYMFMFLLAPLTLYLLMKNDFLKL